MHDQSKCDMGSRFFQRVIRLGLFSLLLFSDVLFAQADFSQAINYLKVQQSADGSVSNNSDIATAFQTTHEAIRAFHFLDENDAAVLQAARDFINAQTYRNTENLSRLLISASLFGAGQAEWLSLLSQHQNRDGGFGEFQGYDSTVIDTAMALEALALSGLATDQVTGNAVGFLLDQQLSSGAWSDGSNDASIYKSAIAMRALWHYRSVFSGVAMALEAAKNYFYTQQDAFGLWGETYQSALVLIALIPNASEYSTVEALSASLAAQQKDNGSWDDSPYTTALALRALRSQPTLLPAVTTEGSIIGKVLDADTRQAIANAMVQVNGSAISENANISGEFELPALTAGSYSLTLSAAGYAAVVLSNINVAAGSVANIGNVRLSSQPNSGVLQGRVTNSANGQALAGVSISVSGAATANTISQADGRFSLVGLTPGEITITVISAGYLPVTASSTISAGSSLVFNPVMVAVETAGGTLPGVSEFGELRGQVINASSGLPIQGAYIRLTLNGSINGKLSAANGSYVFAQLAAGEISVNVSKAGYFPAQATGRIAAGNATVFNVSLAPESAGPGDGSGTIETEPLPGTPTTGTISGSVRNAENGTPLAGAQVIVSGSFNATTQTAADGRYNVADVTPGEIQIAVSQSGFVPVSANGHIAAGNIIDFSPELLPEGSTVDLPAAITGRVIDASSGQGLRDVSIVITNQSSDFTAGTDNSGRFDYSVDPAGNYAVTFSKVGYVSQSLSVVLPGGATLDFQTIELKRATSEVAVYGTVSDRESGDPIAWASVAVLGTAISVQADESGRYRLNGVGEGTRTLIFSATGYGSQTLSYRFPQGGEYEINRRLSLSNSTGLAITAMMLNQDNYGAYEVSSIQTSIFNDSVVSAQGSIEFTLYNQQDIAVHMFAASFVDGNGDTQTAFVFEPGVVTDVPVVWNTMNIAPGDYRLVGRIIAGNVFVGPAKVILAERATDMSIRETRAIELLSLTSLPAYSAVGASDFFTMQADILNRSNVEYEFAADLRLRSPSGDVLLEESRTIHLFPDEAALSFEWVESSITFSEAGEHRLELIRRIGPQPRDIQLDVISVAPGLRIDAIQSLDPPNVTPDGDKRIRLRVRLEGRELQ